MQALRSDDRGGGVRGLAIGLRVALGFVEEEHWE